MKQGLIMALAAAAGACAPAPVEMPAAQASEVLNLFAAGRGPASVCSADGRALLRSAVRAYAREMSQAGVAWPVVPGVSGEAGNVTTVDGSVAIAFAAGFVKAGDLPVPARHIMTQLTFDEWPEITRMRAAARVACQDVVALQQAAAHYLVERARMADMAGGAKGVGLRAESAERLQRQSVRVARAEMQMNDMAAIVEARMEEAQVG
jgi:hypothetical protein